MLLHIFFYFLFRRAISNPVLPAEALPIITPTVNYTTTDALSLFSLSTRSLEDSIIFCNSNQRSLSDIVWSCLTTLFLCTWVAVHPNVPDPEEEEWKILWRKVKLMYWTFVAPELVLTWAVRQHRGATKLYEKYQAPGRDWTMNHAQFLQMGGFHILGGEHKGVVCPANFEKLLQNGTISFPNIPKAEIQDKSKADGLAKIIMVIQSLWFVFQCVGRNAQGLAVTQFEVSTIAVISSTFMLSLVWWHKPLDVRQPICLDTFILHSSLVGGQALQEEDAEIAKTISVELPAESKHPSALAQGLKEAHLAVGRLVSGHLEDIRSTASSIGKALCDKVDESGWQEDLLQAIVNIFVVWPILNPVFDMVDINDKTVHSGRVSICFAADEPDPDAVTDFIKGLYVPSLSGLLFGLVHCLAWNSDFPTTLERELWRTSSLLMAVSMTVGLLLSASKFYELVGIKNPRIFGPLAIAMAPIYMASRYYLVFESILGLRALPPSAFETVQWARFISAT